MKNNILYFTISLLILSISLISCKKEIHCEQAEVCVTNIGTDTIYYSWGGSDMSTYVIPGDSTCKISEEEVHITSSSESFTVAYFETIGHGSYTIKIKDCHVSYDIE